MRTSPELSYGTIDTQLGVLCDHREDGGIVVTIPSTTWGYITRKMPPSHPIVFLVLGAWYLVEKLRRRVLPPRAIIEMTAEHLRITEPDVEATDGIATRTWPINEVGEIRPNRYSPGLYVRIPGKDNFDMLGDVDPRLIQHVGVLLTESLRRLCEQSRM